MKKMKHQFLIGMVLKLAKIPKDTPGEFREACQFLIDMVLKHAQELIGKNEKMVLVSIPHRYGT